MKTATVEVVDRALAGTSLPDRDLLARAINRYDEVHEEQRQIFIAFFGEDPTAPVHGRTDLHDRAVRRYKAEFTAYLDRYAATRSAMGAARDAGNYLGDWTTELSGLLELCVALLLATKAALYFGVPLGDPELEQTLVADIGKLNLATGLQQLATSLYVK